MRLPDGERLVREWNWEHNVVLVEDANGLEWIFCACLYDSERRVDDCDWCKKARSELMEEAKNKFSDGWNSVGLKEAIVDIFSRIQTGVHLGQVEPGMIYVQEVAKLLEVDENEVLNAVDELFEEKRLDLNGMILKEFVDRFRFPREFQRLIMYMVEGPLGWPNGDAGMITLRVLEDAIDKETRFDSGEDVFWEHNYPNISPNLLWFFGFQWMYQGLRRALESEEAMNRFRSRRKIKLEVIENHLEELLSEVRSLKEESQ